MQRRKKARKSKADKDPVARVDAVSPENPTPGVLSELEDSQDAPEDSLRRLEVQLSDGQHSILKNMTARCKEGTQRAGHGVVLTIQAVSKESASRLQNSELSVDIHGSTVFSALPSGLGYLAPSLLPQDVTCEVISMSLLNPSQRLTRQAEEQVTLQMSVGLRKLSRGRVDQVLQSIIDAGDDPFVFEFRHSKTDKLMGFLPTKASLVKFSMQSGSNINYTGDLPVYGRKSQLVQHVNWLKCMILFTLATWCVFCRPGDVLSTIPSVYSPDSYSAVTVTDVLPLHPTNMSAAFQMGALKEKLDQEYNLAAEERRPINPQTLESLLQQAAKLGGKSESANVTEAQLRQSLQEIIRIENGVSIVSKVRGFFSFINCVWFASILGIFISVGPTLHSVLRPLRELIVRISTFLLHEVLLPTISRLHSWGVFEVLLYGSCWVFLVEGYRVGGDAGVMVGFTGCVLCILCVYYSCALWGKRILKKWRQESFLQLLQTWIIITWIPCAIHFQSSLFGYGVVLAFFSLMGLDARISPLLVQIGFENEERMLRCTLASFLLVSSMTCLRVLEIDSQLLLPFTAPAGVIGNNVFFLSLIILSFASKPHAIFNKIFFNVALATALVVFNILGHVLHVPGMANVSTIYGVLAAMMKYCHFHIQTKLNGWVLMLLVSVAVWRISLFLHLNPGYVMCLFGTL